MAAIKCENGHLYDEKMFFRCPYCGIEFEFVKEKEKNKLSENVKSAYIREDDKTELCSDKTELI